MDKSRDPDPQGRHDRAFWRGEKGHLRRKKREKMIRPEEPETVSFLKKALLLARHAWQWVNF